ncbi:Niemann-Pick C1 protein-like protein, partial [Tanacetum coccineum]
IEVFPYSVFYMFFEKYLNIWKTALISLSIVTVAVFVVCLGVIAILDIQLNDVSVVNLVMSVGIAIEFCVHITHAFLVSSGDRDQRTKEVLGTMGASFFGFPLLLFVFIPFSWDSYNWFGALCTAFDVNDTNNRISEEDAFVDQEVGRQITAIMTIYDLEIEILLTAIRLLKSDISNEQLQTLLHLETICKGSGGVVQLVRHKWIGTLFALKEKGSVTFAVDYEFAARSKPTQEYINKYYGNYTFTSEKAIGYRNLFATPSASFMAEDTLYFINGILLWTTYEIFP